MHPESLHAGFVYCIYTLKAFLEADASIQSSKSPLPCTSSIQPATFARGPTPSASIRKAASRFWTTVAKESK